MRADHASPVGQDLLDHGQDGDFLFAGISAFNSKFSTKGGKHIANVTDWMRGHSRDIGLMFPDEPETANVVALGFTEPAEIIKKVHNGFRGIMNLGKKALATHGIAEEGMLTWERFREHPAYMQTLKELSALYANDATFRADIDTGTAEVLRGKAASAHFRNDNVDVAAVSGIAKDFLLQELAFIVNAANILDKKRAAYVYHRPMPVLEKLLAGDYVGFTPPGNTGFVVIDEKS